MSLEPHGPLSAHISTRVEDAREATRPWRRFPARHWKQRRDCPKRCMRECLQGNAPPRTSTLLAPRFNRLGDFGCGMCPPRSAVIKPPLNHACKCEFPQDLIVGAVVRLPSDDLNHGFLCWAHDGLRWSRETGPENKGWPGQWRIARPMARPQRLPAWLSLPEWPFSSVCAESLRVRRPGGLVATWRPAAVRGCEYRSRAARRSRLERRRGCHGSARARPAPVTSP